MTRPSLPDVLRVLPDPETRSLALSRFRDRGFSLDSFSRPAARAAMAEALTRAEDWLELDHPRRTGERAAIRRVRRALESEPSYDAMRFAAGSRGPARKRTAVAAAAASSTCS